MEGNAWSNNVGHDDKKIATGHQTEESRVYSILLRDLCKAAMLVRCGTLFSSL